MQTLHPRQNVELSYQELTVLKHALTAYAETDVVLSGPRQTALASAFDKIDAAQGRMIKSQGHPQFFLNRAAD